jgi:hypothetical protein
MGLQPVVLRPWSVSLEYFLSTLSGLAFLGRAGRPRFHGGVA